MFPAHRAGEENTAVTRVTLDFMAQELGLSAGTVSRALNGYADIAEATKSRVWDAAARFGYQPNRFARSLARGAAEAAAYIMPRGGGALSEPFLGEMLQGLAESLSKRNWDLLVVQSSPAESEAESVRKLAQSGKIGGCVISRPVKNDARITQLRESGIPFVVHGRDQNSSCYAWYDVDSKKAFIDAVNHLAALGHRRIGFISAPAHYSFAQSRLDGWRCGIKANGLDADEALTAVSAMTSAGGEAAAGAMLDSARPPSALLCATDMQALGALAAVRARGMAPGRDVSVIGYDGLSVGEHSNPPLTTMAQPLAGSGRVLGEMLLAVIDGRSPAGFHKLKTAELVRRMSDGPAPPSHRNRAEDVKPTKGG